MILDIYKDAFRFAGQDLKVLIELGILSFLSFLIIPMFLISGYQCRVIDSGIKAVVGRREELPKFNNLTGMFVDGIKYTVVHLIYLAVPVLITVGLLSLDINQVATFIDLAIGFVLLVIAELYAFVAIPNMVANGGSFKAAFDFRRLNQVISMIEIGEFLIFFIGTIFIIAVISLIVFLILTAVFALFGIAIFSMTYFSELGFLDAYVFSFGAIFVFLVGPYLSLFFSRVSGLVYAIGE